MSEFYSNGTDIFPSEADEGSIFIKASTGEMYRKVGGEWVLIGGSD